MGLRRMNNLVRFDLESGISLEQQALDAINNTARDSAIAKQRRLMLDPQSFEELYREVHTPPREKIRVEESAMLEGYDNFILHGWAMCRGEE